MSKRSEYRVSRVSQYVSSSPEDQAKLSTILEAIESQNEKLLRSILDKSRAEIVETKNEEGHSLLHCAVALDSPQKDMRKIVQILLEYGASIYNPAQESSSPIACAVRDCNARMLIFLLTQTTINPLAGVEMLSEGLRVKVRDNDDLRDNLAAANKKDVQFVQELISMGADVSRVIFSEVPSEQSRIQQSLKGLPRLPEKNWGDYLPTIDELSPRTEEGRPSTTTKATIRSTTQGLNKTKSNICTIA